ncbi:MAG: DUF3791 domain-containing protein [Bacteroidales bacterium]|nr:DUF3791 domain-containing protein [Bacteroidales bacterium]
MFRKYHIFDYLRESFEMLHTQGENYIMTEIDLFIKARQVQKKHKYWFLKNKLDLCSVKTL